MAAFLIRPARESDIAAINEIINYYIINTSYTLALTIHTLEDTRDWFLSHGHQYPLLVAEDKGELIGYAALSKFRPYAGYDQTVEDSVYLKNGYQGQGIGKALLGHILKLGQEKGFHCVVGVINNENKASILLHEKAGFSQNGVLREVGHKNNAYVDVTFMSILFSGDERFDHGK